MQTAQKSLTQSFWNQHPEYSMPEMLTTVEKIDLAETQVPFDIIAVRKITHRQYGETWILTVDIFGFARSIFLSCNEVRDVMIEDVREFIHQTGEYVPAILTQFQTANGYDAWGISPPADQNSALNSGDHDEG